MKIKRLTNTSSGQIELKLGGGDTMFLPSRVSVTNVDVLNLDELRGVTAVQRDLSEVMPGSAAVLPPAVEAQSAGVRADLSEVSRPPVKRKKKKKRLDG